MMLEISCECGKMLQVPHWRSGQKGKCSTCHRAILIPSLYDLGYEPMVGSMPKSPSKKIKASIFYSLTAISFYTMVLGFFSGILCKPLYIELISYKKMHANLVQTKELPKPVPVDPVIEEKIRKPKESIPLLLPSVFPGGWYISVVQSIERLEKNFYGKKYRVEEGREEIVVTAIHSVMKFASFMKEYPHEAKQIHADLREIESKGKNFLEWISFKLENKIIEAKTIQSLKEFALSGNIAIPKEMIKSIENASYNIQHEVESGTLRLETIREIHRFLSQLHQEFTEQKNSILILKKEWSE
ncbi:MAG: hypothetical protein HUU50_13815 [Candidatus Brocadiae bacterium]|nr:hypothetical protein [Candidatus Brocadiia bacterium]